MKGGEERGGKGLRYGEVERSQPGGEDCPPWGDPSPVTVSPTPATRFSVKSTKVKGSVVRVDLIGKV